MLIVLFVVFLLMFLGGAFVCFGEGMADTAGNGGAAMAAFIVAAIGLVGAVVILVIWAVHFFAWLFG